jgi:hypothetical protein
VQQCQDEDAAVRQQRHACSSFSSNSGGGMGSSRRCFVDGGGVMKQRQEEQYTLERNRGARYSPAHHADNGMLRFYLTPLWSASGRPACRCSCAVGDRREVRIYLGEI